MSSTRKLVYQVSTVLIVLLFSATGLVKLSPLIHPDIYDEMEDQFGDFCKVPPADLLRLKPATYMLIVGLIELVCAAAITFGQYRYGKLATWALLVVMFGAIYTHYAVHHPADKFIPAFIALGLVFTRLYTMGALQQAEIKIKL